MKPAAYRIGEARTATEMALISHTLSKDGMTAYTRDKSRWTWSDYFHLWSCVGPCASKTKRS